MLAAISFCKLIRHKLVAKFFQCVDTFCSRVVHFRTRITFKGIHFTKNCSVSIFVSYSCNLCISLTVNVSYITIFTSCSLHKLVSWDIFLRLVTFNCWILWNRDFFTIWINCHIRRCNLSIVDWCILTWISWQCWWHITFRWIFWINWFQRISIFISWNVTWNIRNYNVFRWYTWFSWVTIWIIWIINTWRICLSWHVWNQCSKFLIDNFLNDIFVFSLNSLILSRCFNISTYCNITFNKWKFVTRKNISCSCLPFAVSNFTCH